MEQRSGNVRHSAIPVRDESGGEFAQVDDLVHTMRPGPGMSIRPTADERRASPRVSMTADVSLYSETNFWSGFSEDLSEGGLFIATYQGAKLGTELELTFELPTGHVVKTKGVVRWLRDGERPGVGVQFQDLSDEDLKIIKTFVKHRAPLFYDDDRS